MIYHLKILYESLIPLLSPWKGATWESMVKLTKKAIKAVMKDRTYHEGSFITLLCKIEAMLYYYHTVTTPVNLIY